MTAIAQDFTLYQGDAASPIFTVYDAVGAVIDISSVSDIIWQASRTASSLAVLTKKKSLAGGVTFVTDGTNGQFQVNFLGTDTTPLTGYYLHEAQLIDSLGNQTTVSLGRMQVGRIPAWSYSGDPTTSSKDAVRFLIGDVLSKDPQLQDPEIEFCVSQRSSIYGAAAMACRSIATQYSRRADTVTGELHTLYSSQARAYAARAMDYENQAVSFGGALPYAGGISVTDKIMQNSDTDRVPPQFEIGLDDNTNYPIGPAGPENNPPTGVPA